MDIELCRKMAASFHRTTRIEYEELLQEACAIWCETTDEKHVYDPRKSSLKTFMSWRIHNRFVLMANKRKRQPPTGELDLELAGSEVSPEQYLDWKDRLQALTEEARFVVGLIFESPQEFLMMGSGKAGKTQIIEVLVNKYAYTETAAKSAVREIRRLLAA